MEQENKENTEQANTPPETNPVKEKNTSLRESLEKNLKAADTDKDPADPESHNGTATDPAKGKSFVNNQVVETPDAAPKPVRTVQAPGDMSPEERAVFEKSPPEIQGYLARRALDVRRLITETGEKARTYQELESVITPDIRDEYARQNTRIPQLVENAIAWDKAFKANKTSAAVEYLQAQGVDLNEFVNGVANGTLYKEPEPKYLTPEEAEKLWEEKRQLEQQSRIAEESHSALQSFLSNPVFQDSPEVSEARQLAVAREVRILKEIEGVQGSTQAILDEALKRAVTTSDAFSSVRTAQSQQAPTAAKPADVYEQMEKVRRAKLATKTISGSLGSGSPVQKHSSLRESLEANWHKS